ncbi:MAG: MerR family transcriptional regulator [Acidobacteria bacterium]|nr:MerR family transcriptional regulator [Acidobacteriota bacterium]
MAFHPTRLYYKIGEVCRIVGVEAHVLRYWETEFSSLAPPKNKGGQRTYRPRDIELLLQIRKLLYEDGFTIAGARKQLSVGPTSTGTDGSAASSGRPGRTAARGKRKGAPKERISQVRQELENILTLLDRG